MEEFFKRLKCHQEVENLSDKSVLVVLQDLNAKILADNLTVAFALAVIGILKGTPGRPRIEDDDAG